MLGLFGGSLEAKTYLIVPLNEKESAPPPQYRETCAGKSTGQGGGGSRRLGSTGAVPAAQDPAEYQPKKMEFPSC